MRKLKKIVSLLLIAVFLAFGIWTYQGIELLPDDLRIKAEPTDKLLVTDRFDTPLLRTYQTRWNVTSQKELHEIPEFLRRVFVAVEDKRFYEHHGIDIRAKLLAIWQSIKARRIVRGASTINEQVVRIYHPRPRNLRSKWFEVFEAYLMRQPKGEILNFYLNQIMYGRNLRGVAQAASYYFDRDLDTLNYREMLALAVLVRAPGRLDPKRNIKDLEEKLDATANQLYKRKFINKEEFNALIGTKLQLQAEKPPVEASQFVRKVLFDNKVNNSGKLKTTINGVYQTHFKKLLDKRLADLSERNVSNAALLAVNHKTNEIEAWVNAGKFVDNQVDGVLAKRQPGSTLKPFVYALALSKGWNAATVINDAPFSNAVNRGVHQYRNFSRVYYGPIRLRLALANSLNIPAIKAANFVTPQELLRFLHNLGLKSLTKSAEFYGEGLALGNGEISLYELVRAYSVFARAGEFDDFSYLPQKSTKRDAKLSKKIVSEEIASIITDILSDPEARKLEFENGGGGFNTEVAFKTGTSSDFTDAWAVGYSNNWTVGVWFGNFDAKPMEKITGAVAAIPVLKTVFSELERGKGRKLYRSNKLVKKEICEISGKLASKGCPSVTEFFVNESDLRKRCEGHHKKTIDTEEVKIVFPLDQTVIARDPRIPDQAEALEFKISNVAKLKQVSWFLDGEPLSDSNDETLTWHLISGTHILQAVVYRDGDDEGELTREVEFTVK